MTSSAEVIDCTVNDAIDLPAATASPAEGVTIIIAAWRASATIGRAVASALAQPEALEVVVVDDASGDGGATISAALAADDGTMRLKVIPLDSNGGPSRARNVAIAASKAPWICVLDSDDWMESGRLAALIPLTQQGYDMIADDLVQTTGELARGAPMWFRDRPEAQDVDFETFVRNDIPMKGHDRREMGFFKPLMRREFLDRHEIRYVENMRLGEDYDLYARILARGARMRLTPWCGYVSLIREDSLSGRHSRADLAAYLASDDRLLRMPIFQTSEIRAIQAHRLSTLEKLAWIDFMAALKSRRVFAAAGIVVRDPRMAAPIVSGLLGIVARRLGLKKG
jgi:succinoglycan biosynthesis protein ExoU